MKTLFSSLLVGLTAFLTASLTARAQFSYITNNGAITITGYSGAGGMVALPGTINGLAVTDIQFGSFWNDGSLTSVTIPGSVTNIGPEAFGQCQNLTNVAIGDGVTSIGASAFENCQNLTTVEMGNGVRSIGDLAFINTGLTAVTLPAGLTSLGVAPFASCPALTVIDVAAGNPSYRSLGGVLFNQDLTRLIEFPSGVAGTYSIPVGVTGIGGSAFCWCQGLTNVAIPNSVTNIEDGAGLGSDLFHGAFLDCQGLASVAIPDSVGSIGSYAFVNSGLQTASIGDRVAEMGPGAFAFCARLNAVYFNGNLPSTSTDSFFSSAFDSCPLKAVYYRAGAADWSTTFAGIPTVAFGPMGAIAFGADPTNNAAPLTVSFTAAPFDSSGYGVSSWAWTFGDGSTSSAPNPTHTYTNAGTFYPTLIVTNSVGAAVPGYGPPSIIAANPAALLACITNNNSILITAYTGPGGALIVPGAINGLPVTAVGTNAFAGSGLTSIALPDSVRAIGAGAFEGCPGLTSVSIPNGTTNIGDYAFFSCWNLTNVTFGGSLVSIGAYAFSGSAQVGPGIPWEGCSLLSITIPDTVVSIGDHAFYFCSLTNVLIGGGVTNIGEGAFTGCPLTAFEVAPGNPAYSSLAGVLFNRTRTTLLEYPSGLGGSYTIPNGVTNVGDYAFYDCTGLTDVLLNNGLISIGTDAFSGDFISASMRVSLACRLTSIFIPASVASVEPYAFSGCFLLTNASFLGNAPGADSTVFSGIGARGPFADPITAYYLPGTSGWAVFATNTAIPTALWAPQVQAGSANPGAQTNHVGFTISWAPDLSVVVEAATNLSQPEWTPVATNTLNGSGIAVFSDAQWPNHPARFFRVRWP